MNEEKSISNEELVKKISSEEMDTLKVGAQLTKGASILTERYSNLFAIIKVITSDNDNLKKTLADNIKIIAEKDETIVSLKNQINPKSEE